MKATLRTIVLSVAGTLVLFWHAGGSSQEPDPATEPDAATQPDAAIEPDIATEPDAAAEPDVATQPDAATEPDAGVTQEGLQRVDPSIMAAAWVKPDFDLSGYTRIMLMPTAVQFRDVPERSNNARTRATTEEFPLTDERKEWFRRLWREAVQGKFAPEDQYEFFAGVDSSVLVVQGYLVDVVSRIPPIAPGSAYTLTRDPWSAAIVLELRDAATAELVARTIDRRNAEGLLEVATVWYLTEDLVERWAEVLSERLDELSELGGLSREGADWGR